MKNKLIAITIASLSVIFLATGCGIAAKAGSVPENQAKPVVETPAETPGETPGEAPEEERKVLDIDILVKGAILDKERAIKFTVKNPLDEALMYGAPFTIERLKAGTTDVWEKTALTDELAFDMMLRIIEPGCEAEDQVFMDYIKDIEAGTYRIVRLYATDTRTEITLHVNFRVTEAGELLYGLEG
ncbi:MAG TPA: immunoglobulin-like domain-containing protein [Clostridiaceae bacterium]|nr:immunoglobulin-like domain-containing protein [Clostridiaceae bacterium]